MADPAPRLELREEHGGRIVRVILRAPPDNALDLDLLNELTSALDALARAPDLCCLVLESGTRDFSTGLDPSQRRLPYVELLLPALHGVARRLASLEALIVTRVRGRCLGAGLELALLSNAILCDATAKFGLPDLTQGLFSPLGALLLPSRLGRTRAEEWLLSGLTIDGEGAHAAGLAQEFAGGWDDLDSMTERWLQRIVLARPPAALKVHARASRLHLDALLARPLDELEQLYLTRIAPSAEADEALAAAGRRRPSRPAE